MLPVFRVQCQLVPALHLCICLDGWGLMGSGTIKSIPVFQDKDSRDPETHS